MGCAVFGIYFQNFHRILLRRALADGGENGGGAGMQGIPLPDGDGGAGEAGAGCPENPPGRVGAERTDGGVGECLALEQTRLAGFPFLDGKDLCGVDFSGDQPEKPLLAGADAMAQSGELLRLRVVPGDGANSGNPLAQVHAQHRPAFRLPGRQVQGQPAAAPGDTEDHGCGAFLQKVLNLVDALGGGSIDGGDAVTDFQACIPGGRAGGFVKGGHGDGIRAQLQAYQCADGYQIVRCPGAYRQHPYQKNKNCKLSFHKIPPFSLPSYYAAESGM